MSSASARMSAGPLPASTCCPKLPSATRRDDSDSRRSGLVIALRISTANAADAANRITNSDTNTAARISRACARVARASAPASAKCWSNSPRPARSWSKASLPRSYTPGSRGRPPVVGVVARMGSTKTVCQFAASCSIASRSATSSDVELTRPRSSAIASVCSCSPAVYGSRAAVSPLSAYPRTPVS